MDDFVVYGEQICSHFRIALDKRTSSFKFVFTFRPEIVEMKVYNHSLFILFVCWFFFSFVVVNITYRKVNSFSAFTRSDQRHHKNRLWQG